MLVFFYFIRNQEFQVYAQHRLFWASASLPPFADAHNRYHISYYAANCFNSSRRWS